MSSLKRAFAYAAAGLSLASAAPGGEGHTASLAEMLRDAWLGPGAGNSLRGPGTPAGQDVAEALWYLQSQPLGINFY